MAGRSFFRLMALGIAAAIRVFAYSPALVGFSLTSTS